MGQRTKNLSEIWGFNGWKVEVAYFEDAQGTRFDPLDGYGVLPETRLVLRVVRRWAPRCGQCGTICRAAAHERLPRRRWQDLTWAGRPTVLEAELIRVKCKHCNGSPVELLPWAEPRQRQTKRLQQHLALEAASMPVMHVAVLHGLDWHTVRRAEGAALVRWAATRPDVPLRHVGVDEKWLGRRHSLDHEFVTIVSNLETGEPLWIGPHRRTETLRSWLDTLSPEQKAGISLFAMDMHRPFLNAVMSDPQLKHAVVVHDPFHIMKRAGEAVTEVRKDTFFSCRT